MFTMLHHEYHVLLALLCLPPAAHSWFWIPCRPLSVQTAVPHPPLPLCHLMFLGQLPISFLTS